MPSTEPPVDRRVGCVVPLVIGGALLTLGGISIVYDWLVLGGRIELLLLLACIGLGPAMLAFAYKTYRDPTF